MQNHNWHSLSVNEVMAKLKTSKTGLSEAEAQKRIGKHGKNQLPIKKRFTYIGTALSQFKSPMVYVLLIAAAVSFLMKEYIDMGVILFAVFINTIVGFIQEIKAEEALASLSQIIEHKAYVLRDGIEKEINATDVTLGDMLILKAGDMIPVDGRILEAHELEIEEAVLTGESMPVKKEEKILDRGGGMDSKKNMVYMGATVLRGRGLAVVTDIAVRTKYGRIATLFEMTRENETPLQIELKKFSNSFGEITFIILFVILLVGLYRGVSFIEIFTTSVAIAVAAIPEGLLVAVTIILAIGMQRILKNGSLVRKLMAVETLGNVSIICTDKTGTLTKGIMQVDHILTLNSVFKVRNDCKNIITKNENDGDYMKAIRIGMVCNDAVVENPDAKLEDWIVHGNYTEQAFLRAGLCTGYDIREINKKSIRINEIPFNSERKFMATLNREGEGYFIYIKGAAEEIINRSNRIFVGGTERHMNEDNLRFLRQKQAEMSREGLQVMGVAFKNVGKESVLYFRESNDENIIVNLTFIGLVALKDPLRPQAKDMVEMAKRAGIKTVIITGDNAITARAIANELGMKIENENILDGERLDQMSTKDFNNIVAKIKLYARVLPRHKLRIVEAWQSRGEVVAMTGDGVNDAPALKKADIGVALESGTDVAKGAADMILLNDNFRTIITAVWEGRIVFENIRKVILYLISDSFSEVVIVGGSLLMGLAVPVTAAQILWINIITDSFPNLALTLEPKERSVMLEKPRKRNEPLLNNEMKILVIAISLVSGLVSLIIFYYCNLLTGDFVRASTIAFSILSVDSLVYVFNLRSLSTPVFRQNIFSNLYLILAVVLAFLFQLYAVYNPFLQEVLHTKALGFSDWIIVILASFFTATVVEIIKFIFIVRKVQE